MSIASDPSAYLARRSRIARFMSPTYSSGERSASLVHGGLRRIEYRSFSHGQGRPVTSFESFLASEQEVLDSGTETVVLSKRPFFRHGDSAMMDTSVFSSATTIEDSVAGITAPTLGLSPVTPNSLQSMSPGNKQHKRILSRSAARVQSRIAQRANDAMIYLDGPSVYCCGECGTHLTTHDDIVSKSFHGRHGRAFLLNCCVNVTIGPSEDRRLMTGLHSVCDILCKRCNTLIGWMYKRAYESSQKYKEGKFIVEKIFLHLENDSSEASHYDESRRGSWRKRSYSYNGVVGSPHSSMSSVEVPCLGDEFKDTIFEYPA